MTRLYLFLIILLITPVVLYAQSDQDTSITSDPRLETRIGYLLQQQFYYYPEAASGNQTGFRFPTARVRLNSFWDEIYELFVQVDFVRPITVLDAFLTVPMNNDVELVAGLFKSPFSREFLLFPEDLPLLERSRVVQSLAPNRQIGAALRVEFLDDRLTLEAGVFNGNGATLDANNNDAFLFTGRLNWMTPLPDGGIQVGINAGYSEDSGLIIPSVGTSNDQRVLLGADGEVILERWLVRGEFIVAGFGPRSTVDMAYGYTGTVGYKILEGHQVFTSIDVFDPEADLPEYATFGYKVYLGEVVSLLANYRLPLDDPNRGEAVLRLQFAVR